MTYNELIVELQALSDEQRQMNVTIQVDDEFYPASLWIIDNDNILDKGHPIISNHD